MDQTRPKHHFTAKKNWINDPVGLCYFKGEYHMYFQYFPYGCEWGTMHWGHAKSKDMFNWTEVEIALFPSIEADKNGVFSGTTFIENDTMHVFYTGVEYLDYDPSNIHIIKPDGKFISSQIKISSKSSEKFDNYNGKKVVIPPIEDSNIGSKIHTRDPLVYKEGKYYYMLLGTQVDDNSKLLVYQGKTLEDFKLHIEYDLNNLGTMLECPSRVNFENRAYLIFSPENYNDDKINYPSNTGYMVFKSDFEKASVELAGDFILLDEGYDIYAAQAFEDREKEQVYIAWIRTPRTLEGQNYRGIMTYPRILKNENDKLQQFVHPNIASQFSEEVFDFNPNTPAKISCNLHQGELLIVGGVRIFYDNKILLVDRTEVFGEYPNIAQKFTIGLNHKVVNLEIYYDLHVIEIYINHGEKVFTNYLEIISDEFHLPNQEAKIFVQKKDV